MSRGDDLDTSEEVTFELDLEVLMKRVRHSKAELREGHGGKVEEHGPDSNAQQGR